MDEDTSVWQIFGHPRHPWEYPILPTWGDRVGAVLADGALVIEPMRPPTSARLFNELIATVEELLGIPRGFPFWYRPEQLALPVGPIGRAQNKIRAVLDDPIARALINEAVL